MHARPQPRCSGIDGDFNMAGEQNSVRRSYSTAFGKRRQASPVLDVAIWPGKGRWLLGLGVPTQSWASHALVFLSDCAFVDIAFYLWYKPYSAANLHNTMAGIWTIS